MKKLNLIAPVGATGYGVVGFNVLKGLQERGWEVSLFPKGPSGRGGEEAQIVNKAIACSDTFDYDANCLNLWHQFDLGQSVGRGRYIGWPIFELDNFTDREKHHLAYPDQLIVCSRWAKDIIEGLGIREEGRCNVVPLGVDLSVFDHRKVKEEKGNTIFLNVGKWEVRKGHDILLELFEEAFTPEDKVELWLMPHNPFLNEAERTTWERMYLKSEMGRAGKINIIPWQANGHHVAQIMGLATVGIFPSRAEGWNLELLEMMAMGKNCITTCYSAHTEFCHPGNAMAIKIKGVEEAYDGKWFDGKTGNWADLSDKWSAKIMMVSLMKAMHREAQSEEGLGPNKDAIETAQRLTWDNTIDILEGVLDG